MHRIARIASQLAAAQDGPIKLSFEGPNREVGIIAMDSASNMNALDEAMRASLAASLRSMERDKNVKVICLRSNLPKVFCAGANIKDLVTLTHETVILDEIFRDMEKAFNSVRKPVIAAINKLALGGGLEIALMSDIIICSEDASIGLPEIKLGVMPGIGGTLISKVIGKSNANKLILTGETITAKQALEWGIVSEVHKPEELHKKQLELALKIAKYSLYTVATAKTAIKFSFENPGPQAVNFEKWAFDSLLNLPGAKEGLPAFVARRAPDFTNK